MELIGAEGKHGRAADDGRGLPGAAAAAGSIENKVQKAVSVNSSRSTESTAVGSGQYYHVRALPSTWDGAGPYHRGRGAASCVPGILEPECGILFASVFVSIAAWTWNAIQTCVLCTTPGLICVPGW